MTQDFWVFALTALMLNLTPGNDMLYVMARSSGQGTKAGIVSSFGIAAGCMVHILAAVAGISAVIAQSAIAFNTVKYLGVVYLLYLGVKGLFAKKSALAVQKTTPLPLKKIFWQGFITNVLNPKVALFFLAFLPQFLQPAGNIVLETLLLGAWFNSSGTLVNILVALMFGKIGSFLARSPKFVLWQERISGLLLIALGIKVALSSKK